MSRLVHFPVTRIMLYLGGIAVALWILRLTARGLAAGLGAWWPAGAVTHSAVVSGLEFRSSSDGVRNVVCSEPRNARE